MPMHTVVINTEYTDSLESVASRIRDEINLKLTQVQQINPGSVISVQIVPAEAEGPVIERGYIAFILTK